MQSEPSQVSNYQVENRYLLRNFTYYFLPIYLKQHLQLEKRKYLELEFKGENVLPSPRLVTISYSDTYMINNSQV